MTGSPSQDNPWSVLYLNEMIASRFKGLASVWVEGEITQWKISNGHVYGVLRDLDADAKISFTIWRNVASKLDGKFANGDRVSLYGVPSYWTSGGSISFQATRITHTGLGAFLERIEQLRAKFIAEGVFDAAHKKPIPFLPQCIGLVTGRDSDAEKDVKQNVFLRLPHANFKTVYPLVQGEKAAEQVAQAIAELDTDPLVDVIIVARGGGDLLHLLPFSDERVVRAAFAAKTPIISAIGHEADRPLLDEVADLRASTPTDAAKRVVPDLLEEKATVSDSFARIRSRITQMIAFELTQLENIKTNSILARPGKLFEYAEEDIARYKLRLGEVFEATLERKKHELQNSVAGLRALSPLQTLARGYAIVQGSSGNILLDSKDTSVAEKITVTLHRGEFAAKVTDIPTTTPTQDRLERNE